MQTLSVLGLIDSYCDKFVFFSRKAKDSDEQLFAGFSPEELEQVQSRSKQMREDKKARLASKL